MENKKNIDSLKFEPLSSDNLKKVHQMCEENVLFVSQSYDTFERASLGTKLYNPELTTVVFDDKGDVVAFFMVVLRRSNVLRKKRKVAVLKFFVVEKSWRYKGLTKSRGCSNTQTGRTEAT